MGVCTSTAGYVFPFLYATKQLTREQIYLVDKYLKDFKIHNVSTQAHLQIAAAHWNKVFADTPSSRSTTRQSANTNGRKEQQQHDSATTTGRSKAEQGAPSTATKSGSRIGVLYDTFYEYLGQHSPELQPIFRSSMHVRSKVLLHISAGMRGILANEFVLEKMLALTKTHIKFGVKLEHFNPLGNALMHAMKVASEDAWSTEIEDAWRHMFTHCSAILMVQLRRAIERNALTKIKDREKRDHGEKNEKAEIGPEIVDLYAARK